jgi:hypothetical protein
MERLDVTPRSATAARRNILVAGATGVRERDSRNRMGPLVHSVCAEQVEFQDSGETRYPRSVGHGDRSRILFRPLAKRFLDKNAIGMANRAFGLFPATGGCIVVDRCSRSGETSPVRCRSHRGSSARAFWPLSGRTSSHLQLNAVYAAGNRAHDFTVSDTTLSNVTVYHRHGDKGAN